MMNRTIIEKTVLTLLVVVGTSWAGSCEKSLHSQCRENENSDPVEKILQQLKQKTTELKSYEALVEYRFDQPLFESKTMRKGVLYYAKTGKKSKLRVDFKTLKQDDEKEQTYREEFIFDGIWLTQINYRIKQVRVHQLTEPNKPVDAFELAGRNLPIVGFARIDELKKQFEIKLVEQQGSEQENFIRLHLKVKPDSIYKDKYVSVDFWIDRKLGLPAKLAAISTEEDIYQLKLLRPKVNKGLDLKVFDFQTPAGFEKEIIPLKKQGAPLN